MRRGFLPAAGLLGILSILVAMPAAARPKIWRVGNPADVAPRLAGPVLHLSGGAGDVDAAFRVMIDGVRGCSDCATKVDLVVLRASGKDDYDDYLLAMPGVDSVETILIRKPADASRPEVVRAVRAAEVVFFAGGDQCNYVKRIQGTPVAAAVKEVYARGGAVGGISAGLAIQGEYVFDACVDTVTSAEVLADPYHPRATFTYGFFAWPGLEGVFTDSHFGGRDRMGRLMGFLARQLQDGKATTTLGMGVDEKTALVVGPDGVGTVIGEGSVYFVLADHPPEQCLPGRPLSYSGYKIWKAGPGEKFDLRHRPTAGFIEVSVENGVLSQSPY